MGTNYYAHFNTCTCCARHDEVHIGKSSAGWVFSLHGVRKEDREDCEHRSGTLFEALESCGLTELTSLEHWKTFLGQPDVTIFDEYGDAVTLERLLQRVTERTFDGSADNLHRHSEVHGNLGDYNGDGTWDLLCCAFS